MKPFLYQRAGDVSSAVATVAERPEAASSPAARTSWT